MFTLSTTFDALPSDWPNVIFEQMFNGLSFARMVAMW